MICEAVEAYLAELEEAARASDPEAIATRERRFSDDEIVEAWFGTFDDARHVAYEEARPGRFGRIGAWLRRSSAA